MPTKTYLDEAIRLLNKAKEVNDRSLVKRAIRHLVSHLAGKKLVDSIQEVSDTQCNRCHGSKHRREQELCSTCANDHTDLSRMNYRRKGLLPVVSQVDLSDSEEHEKRILAEQQRISAELERIESDRNRYRGPGRSKKWRKK